MSGEDTLCNMLKIVERLLKKCGYIRKAFVAICVHEALGTLFL